MWCTEGSFFGFQFGLWNKEGYGIISNYTEFGNLVVTLEEIGIKGNFQEKEVFICTDNMVLESIAVAGYSKSEVLFNLVVRLHCLIMRYKYNVRLIYLEGTCIIIKGKYGISRGDMYKGIMKG